MSAPIPIMSSAFYQISTQLVPTGELQNKAGISLLCSCCPCVRASSTQTQLQVSAYYIVLASELLPALFSLPALPSLIQIWAFLFLNKSSFQPGDGGSCL